MIKQEFYRKLAVKAARIADQKKADNIVIYDISRNSSLFYYAVLATAESLPQIRAIEEELVMSLKKEGAYSEHRDGSSSAKWRALDYAGFIVHIFEPSARELYALDKLYHDCKQLPWREKSESSIPAARRSAKKSAGKAVKPVKKKTVKNRGLKKTSRRRPSAANKKKS